MCWASVAGVRIGLAALRVLGVKRSGGTQLYGIVEIGEDHGGTCFGDGVQYATGCTFGKGNIRKQPYGKLALSLRCKSRLLNPLLCRSVAWVSCPTKYQSKSRWNW
jgi:formylmethanofuran dehydrogenase subunit E